MTDDRFSTLITALDHPETREDAIHELGVLGDPRAVDALSAILMSPDTDDAFAYRARKLAAEALGAIGDVTALPVLLAALEEDVSSSVKTSAARTLGILADERATAILIAAFRDDNSDVRSAAAIALGQIAEKYEIELTPLIGLLADTEDAVRDTTAQVLTDLGEKVVPALITALTDSNSTIRGAAANLLGELQDERAREVLRRASYKDTSQWVRSRAKWALEQLPPDEFHWPDIKRDQLAPDPPKETLNVMRSQAPEWPSLDPDSSDSDDMTTEGIRALLDQLDVRLANGEISENIYQRLVARWEKRLGKS